jgi:hypothetical protein
MTRRERRRQRDGYYESEIAADGEIVRRPHHLADSMIRREEAPARFRYGTGYVDSISDPVEQGGWPTQVSGVYPTYNNAVGDPCRCQNGRAGQLHPHPTMASALICVENGRDAATIDGTAAYYAMRDGMADEWKRHGPRPLRDRGCQGRDTDQISRPDPPAAKEWPRGGYGVDPLQHWPNPDELQSMAEGDQCTINGAPGKLVRENGKLVCKPRQDVDSQSVRDAAYYEMVKSMEDAWRRWR